MTSLLLTANLLLHSAFIWGRFAVFRLGDRLSPGAKLIQICALLSMLFDAVLITGRAGSNAVLDCLAMGISAVSGVLFVWAVRTTGLQRLTAIFSHDAPVELIVAGPFRFVRNPFYLAYLLVYLQALVASRSFWAALPLVGMGALYHRAAIVEEKKFLCSCLASQYRGYIAKTGRFLPMFGLSSRPRVRQSINH
jgi:protein-S-isoprenylcysteine O-methyltransferase Ste14